MQKPILAFTLLAALCGAGCATDDDGGDDGSLPGGPDGAPPFTNGVSTLSGHAEAGYVDGRRGEARFANPVNVAVGPDGKVYVADFDNGKIRAVDATDGTTTTVVATAGFQRPFGLAFAADGTLYASTDRDPQGKHGPMSGTIWRIDISARNAVPVAVSIGRPRGLAVLPTGEIVAADYTHHVIQIVDPRTGGVSLLAGAWDVKGLVDGVAGAARFSTPYGVVFADGALIVADYDNHRLRRIALDGTVTAFAGSGTAGYADGTLANAKFNKPQALSITESGEIYVADSENFRLRRIRGNMVETVAGDGAAGYVDDDDRMASEFFGLEGVAVTASGSMVFVADGSRGESVPYHRVRSVKMN